MADGNTDTDAGGVVDLRQAAGELLDPARAGSAGRAGRDPGEIALIPATRHGVNALEDAVLLLTVAQSQTG